MWAWGEGGAVGQLCHVSPRCEPHGKVFHEEVCVRGARVRGRVPGVCEGRGGGVISVFVQSMTNALCISTLTTFGG